MTFATIGAIPSEVDAVIVGAGAARCVLAARLSAAERIALATGYEPVSCRAEGLLSGPLRAFSRRPSVRYVSASSVDLG